MFDKRFVEYLAFQNIVLAILAAVGLARLGLSLAGTPNATAAWLSMNVVGWAGVVYYGVAAHRLGFGSYRHLLPLAFIQIVVQQAIAVTVGEFYKSPDLSNADNMQANVLTLAHFWPRKWSNAL